MDDDLAQRVIEANIAVHSRMAADYNESEPQFRAENIAKVTERVTRLAQMTSAQRMLDLGCGTGFMIDIAKSHVRHIVGVDVTEAMLAEVDRSGPAQIELVTHDTGTYTPDAGAYDLVTAYSFLHHLHDPRPTFATAYRALRPGGVFYADEDPNGAFWDVISGLDSEAGDYHPLVEREIGAVTQRDTQVEAQFGLSPQTFNLAEYGKAVRGGFHATELRAALYDVGFSEVHIHFDWFLGEGWLINQDEGAREERLDRASVVNDALQRALPVSEPMFKYLGFVATR